MSPSKISEVLTNEQSPILEGWVKDQLTATTARADLISESELRADSEHFLKALTTAIKSGKVDIRAGEYAPLLEHLNSLSRSRSKKGFSPSETAGFVFSFKQPLLSSLRRAHGKDSEGLAEDTWTATLLLDKLGLYTTETYQQAREEVIRRQQEEMLELSTPVVQIWDGVVALPLIGTLDSARTNIVMESLLQTVVETRSEIAIIDITGVPTVDTLVAQHLLKTVAAARLMGVECIISGIRPQIAQTMVHLQIDLSAVTTKASMADALRTALKRTGFTVTRNTQTKSALPTV
jgi:rsbT co-antagonist protein RsbR